MANWKLEEMIFVTICQKCDSLPVTTPLADLEYPKGVIFTPDIVYCAKCGAQLTVQVRSMSKIEVEKRDEKVAEAAEVAKTKVAIDAMVVVDEFAKVDDTDCLNSFNSLNSPDKVDDKDTQKS